ncbi:non-canonical purine NTP pyrophosphatase, rdgB/HAM1 family [gamma proteobacterium HTCC5015]|nr:non-canonical purine NTP pyrophosphatase, rdgB/HAM1 family [gamma proteobacterium HTCC5015]
MKIRSNKLVLASGNQGKLKEMQALLESLGLEVLPQSNFNTPEADETGLSFVENAIIKARNAAKYSGWVSVADDSGLEVDFLKGAPGIYSARYSGPEATDETNNKKLLYELRGIPEGQRGARFHCALALVRHEDDPAPLIVHRTWEGRILESPQGEQGFGYDPLFFVPSEGCSSAELDRELKNRISHRGQAMQALLEKLNA